MGEFKIKHSNYLSKLPQLSSSPHLRFLHNICREVEILKRKVLGKFRWSNNPFANIWLSQLITMFIMKCMFIRKAWDFEFVCFLLVISNMKKYVWWFPTEIRNSVLSSYMWTYKNGEKLLVTKKKKKKKVFSWEIHFKKLHRMLKIFK